MIDRGSNSHHGRAAAAATRLTAATAAATAIAAAAAAAGAAAVASVGLLRNCQLHSEFHIYVGLIVSIEFPAPMTEFKPSLQSSTLNESEKDVSFLSNAFWKRFND